MLHQVCTCRQCRITRTSLFLSYARGDDEPFVSRLHAHLTARGFDVWFDRVSMPSRNLTFHQEIRDAIAARDRLLLVVRHRVTKSLYVRQDQQFRVLSAAEGRDADSRLSTIRLSNRSTIV